MAKMPFLSRMNRQIPQQQIFFNKRKLIDYVSSVAYLLWHTVTTTDRRWSSGQFQSGT